MFVIHGQMLHARLAFNLSIGVDMLEDHFVNEAMAFMDHPSRKTTRVDLIMVRDCFSITFHVVG